MNTVLVTAVVDSLDPRTGQPVEQPVLSVTMPRAVLAQLDFGKLAPSDAIEQFHHRGDFKASRKSEAFQSITSLTPADMAHTSIEEMSLQDLLNNTQKLRAELKCEIAELRQRTSDTILQTSR